MGDLAELMEDLLSNGIGLEKENLTLELEFIAPNAANRALEDQKELTN